LAAHGEAVGLPSNQMGNSEVGHLHIGAGRIIKQSLARVNDFFSHKDWFKNDAFQFLTNYLNQRTNNKLHIIGMISDGGVHSHINHLLKILDYVSEMPINICLHLVTDGRDTAPKVAENYLQIIQQQIKDKQNIVIASLHGRYYLMDRDQK
jgi:2,3-bisphosphoglycerate-independent phosphoglycerate mutase